MWGMLKLYQSIASEKIWFNQKPEGEGGEVNE